MKKILLIIIAFFCISTLSGQNLQLHYDFTDANSERADGRDYMTATFEMFKPDSLGSTFWFIDLDFNGKHHEPSLSYLEIARDFKMWDFPLAIHGEYNGGYLYNSRVGFADAFANVGIFGVSTNFELANVSFGTYAGYRYEDYNKEGPDFQWTLTWFTMLWDKRISLAGFFDVWTDDDYNDMGKTDGKRLIVITEPQIWYNITPAIAAGGEVEISHNFIFGSKKLEVFPTLGAKFTF